MPDLFLAFHGVLVVSEKVLHSRVLGFPPLQADLRSEAFACFLRPFRSSPASRSPLSGLHVACAATCLNLAHLALADTVFEHSLGTMSKSRVFWRFFLVLTTDWQDCQTVTVQLRSLARFRRAIARKTVSLNP